MTFSGPNRPLPIQKRSPRNTPSQSSPSTSTSLSTLYSAGHPKCHTPVSQHHTPSRANYSSVSKQARGGMYGDFMWLQYTLTPPSDPTPSPPFLPIPYLGPRLCGSFHSVLRAPYQLLLSSTHTPHTTPYHSETARCFYVNPSKGLKPQSRVSLA